jgi:alkylation response protein AidB-like acyl-CoA dehydrogenase
MMMAEVDETLALFRESVARYFPEQAAQESRGAGPEADKRHWQDFAELGWLGVGFDEALGGCRGTSLLTATLMEGFGRALRPTPFLSSVVMAGEVLGRGPVSERADRVAGGVCDGTEIVNIAFAEPGARQDPAAPRLTARATPGGFILGGSKLSVPHADEARHIIVSARTVGDGQQGGVVLLLVEAGADGIAVKSGEAQGGGRIALITFDQVFVPAESSLTAAGEGRAALERALDAGAMAVVWEAIGCMSAALQRTVDYLNTRKQFGQPLSSFQGLQHRVADMRIKCEMARALAQEASRALDRADAEARKATVSAAKVLVSRTSREVCKEAIQLHGGIGMTDELPLGRALMRVTALAQICGEDAYHLRRFSDLQMPAASVGAHRNGTSG